MVLSEWMGSLSLADGAARRRAGCGVLDRPLRGQLGPVARLGTRPHLLSYRLRA